jgi:hypothetical protein
VKVETFEQYSEAWWQGRRGIATSSMMGEIVTPAKCLKSSSFRTAAFEKAGEIISGKTEESYSSEWMDRGKELESEARDFYNFITDNNAFEIGMIIKDDDSCACSPDGVNLDLRKGLEIKSPKQKTHTQYLYDNKLPTKYKAQVYSSLWICDEIDTWSFMSYYPGMSPLIVEVTRDDPGYQKYAAALEIHVPEFNALVQKIVSKIKER